MNNSAMKDFNIETELREIITSAIDLNKVGCTHSEIVADIAPNIQAIYKHGENEGFIKGCNTVLLFLQPQRKIYAELCGEKHERVWAFDMALKEVEKIKDRHKRGYDDLQ